MKISENDRIIVMTKKDLSSIGDVKTHVFKSKIFGEIPFSSFIGKDYFEWYVINESKLDKFEAPENFENKRSLNEKSQQKITQKKIEKKLKLVQAIPPTPLTVFEYYKHKSNSYVSFLNLPEFSYIFLMIQFCKNVLISDAKKEILKFAINYTGNIKFKKLKNFDGVEMFDALVVIDDENIIEMVENHKKFVHKIVVFTHLRLKATSVFYHLMESSEFVNVNMVDFFSREYQANENVHPIVRGNTGFGYVITANCVFD